MKDNCERHTINDSVVHNYERQLCHKPDSLIVNLVHVFFYYIPVVDGSSVSESLFSSFPSFLMPLIDRPKALFQHWCIILNSGRILDNDSRNICKKSFRLCTLVSLFCKQYSIVARHLSSTRCNSRSPPCLTTSEGF